MAVPHGKGVAGVQDTVYDLAVSERITEERLDVVPECLIAGNAVALPVCINVVVGQPPDWRSSAGRHSEMAHEKPVGEFLSAPVRPFKVIRSRLAHGAETHDGIAVRREEEWRHDGIPEKRVVVGVQETFREARYAENVMFDDIGTERRKT